MRARIDSASHGKSQVPLKASRVNPTIAARVAPTRRGMPRRPTARASPVSTIRSATSAMTRGLHRLLVKYACGSRPPSATAATREGQRVPAAAPVYPGHEQGGQQQVEDHLVGQRPHHVGQVLPGQHVRHHQQLGQDGRLRIRALAAQPADVHRAQGQRDADGKQVQRVEPEDPADPEGPHAALAFQRRGHDVAADDEEDEDAVVAGVDPLVDGILHAVPARSSRSD